ncbi:hypothetical protein M8C21_022110 [Ambrosia artemisiifolia]|uniref:Myosin motor domain-containing protein n=1 Tax=Ambrosia artemisiifolia TaxID=4212 RepID=A0AAD5CXC6_AMBAR|nr:hypothetical protein M8C21_022110 [Ambrosia artemisiifolia]
MARSDFIIAHYAGEVHYQCDQFLDKNKDYIVPEHQDLLSASKCSFVAGLFPPLRQDATKSSKFSSIGTRFKVQLQQLMETLKSTQPHYIRCVKPNNVLKPTVFENVNVIHQLRCGGVLEAIRISCAGYPTNKAFTDVVNRFGLLAPEVFRVKQDKKDACRMILDKAGIQGYQIGKTRVFLRAGHMAALDARRVETINSAVITIQRMTRRYLIRKRFLAMANLAVALQTLCRGRLAAKAYEDAKKRIVSTKIQSNFRRYTLRASYTRLRHAVVLIQAGLRAMAARYEFRYRRRHKAATKLQAKWRGHRDHRSYKKLTKAILVTQCGWRGKVARREFERLKMASVDIGALIQENKNLKIQVKELTQRLEKQIRVKTELEDALHAKEHELVTEGSDVEKIDSSTAEVEKLMALLESERQRAEEYEEKYAEAQETIAIMRSAENDGKTELEDGLLTKEIKYASEVSDETSSLGKEAPSLSETEKIDRLASELEELKALLESERQRAKRIENKFSEALDTIEIMHAKLEETERRVLQLQQVERRTELNETMLSEKAESAKEASDGALSVVKNSEDSGRIESLTEEVLLESERQRADESEIKYAKALESINVMHLKLEETERKAELEDRILDKENEYPMEASCEALSVGKKSTVSVEDTEKMQNLSAEVENLKALVELERQRADACEKKYTEALESNEIKRQKFEETERRVLQLQDALNRMIYSMSDQFSELKSMLCASSSSSVTSGFVMKEGFGDATSTSSDITSNESDFAFPAPNSTVPNTVSPQKTVHAHSVPGKQPESGNWESDRESAFDDVF